MLVNQQAHGGTRALYEYDETLFDGLSVPEGVDKQLVIDDILFRHGDAPLAFPDPVIMKYYIGSWSSKFSPLWERMYSAITAEYNPIENYDRMEEKTETGGSSYEQSGTQSGTSEGQVSAENETGYQPDAKTIDDSETSDEGSSESELRTESRVHGNIGVTTSQQMLNQELDLLPRLDIVRYISDSYKAEFCLGYYNY